MNIKEYIQKNHNKDFGWGTFDCYKFVLGWIKASYPNTPVLELHYSTKKEAINLAKTFRWKKEIQKRFNFESVSIKDLKDGDILIIDCVDYEASHLIANGMAYSPAKCFGLVGMKAELVISQAKSWELLRLKEALK